MKMNLDYYKGEDLYCDGDTEKEILEYEKKYDEKDFNEIFKTDVRWPIFYHLTDLRKNIINWYPFKEGAEVLEIGAGMGAITSTLCEKAGKVTSVELSKQRATSIANRCKEKENLEIIVGNFNDIIFQKKYDYITLIGVLEYAPLYTGTERAFNDFLDKIKKLLKKDGKLLIAIENQFGMKYYAGAKEDHTAIEYDGISGYKNKSGIRTFGKEELKEILKNSGFKYTKFYYPLPDYKLPNKIFSEDYLPNENTIEEYTPYYNDLVKLNFDEKIAYKEVIKNNMFEFFANSFFVECSENFIDTVVDLENIKLNEISKEENRFYKKEDLKKQQKEIDKSKKIDMVNSKFNANIIKWYEFKNTKKILQIGKNENISKYLEEIFERVLVIDKIENLKEETFDYILMYDVKDDVNIVANYLTEDGKILYICNNSFGIRNWGKYSIEDGQGVKELEKYNNEIKLENFNTNTYYVFPNYLQAEIIVNEKMNVQKSILEKYNPIIDENEIKIFDETKVLKNILCNRPEMLRFFANSYFIEISKSKIGTDVKLVSYNNCRNEQYRLVTIIKDDIVKKIPANTIAKQHINDMKKIISDINECQIEVLDYEKDGTIYSNFIKNTKTLDEILNDNYDNLDNIVNILNEIKEILLKNSIGYDDCAEKVDLKGQEVHNVENLHFMKKAFWDMVPKNCFYLNDKYVFFDQEWEKEYLPVEFIIYRSVINSYDLVRQINVNELLEKLGILQYKEYFEKIDEELRKEIINEDLYKEIYCKKTNAIDNLINDKKIAEMCLENANQDNRKKQKYIEELEEDNRKKQEYIKVLEERKKSFWKR